MNHTYFGYDKKVDRHLSALAQTIMRRQGGLAIEERELIAAFVSIQNESHYCTDVHATCAAQFLGEDLVERVLSLEYDVELLSIKIRALLTIAESVQILDREQLAMAVKSARLLGASEAEIADTILVASFFCMTNRYVDAGPQWKLGEPNQVGASLAQYGYLNSLTRFFRETLSNWWRRLWPL